jgi:hypothetical protein
MRSFPDAVSTRATSKRSLGSIPHDEPGASVATGATLKTPGSGLVHAGTLLIAPHEGVIVMPSDGPAHSPALQTVAICDASGPVEVCSSTTAALTPV